VPTSQGTRVDQPKQPDLLDWETIERVRRQDEPDRLGVLPRRSLQAQVVTVIDRGLPDEQMTPFDRVSAR
jgi:hypothetical protein